MRKIEHLLNTTSTSQRINYFNAYSIARPLYEKIVSTHAATQKRHTTDCLLFCFFHLSTTVNLSICNSWIASFENLYLIPKRSSLNTTLLRHIHNPTRLLKSRKRSAFFNTIEDIKFIASQSNAPVILFDIGGYFAPYIDYLSAFLGDRLQLVLEDTANGHIKYTKTLFYTDSDRFKSVAYDACKMAENITVANIMLAHIQSFIPDWSVFKSILVIGYGRIGRSLCFGLRRQGAKTIVVVDVDKAQLFMAATEGFDVLTICQLVSVADRFDYCFSMTGQHGVTENVLVALKHHSHLSVVTSYDDEFDLNATKLFENSCNTHLEWNGKTINVTNGGHPINLSPCAAFDARNLSLHFLFTRILTSFLDALSHSPHTEEWDDALYLQILAEIQTS